MAIHTLNITKSGTGTGTVTSDVGTPTVNCGSTCTVFQISGSTVTLTATADPGSTFVGWTGDMTSSLVTDSYVQTVNPSNINAEFSLTGTLVLIPLEFPNAITDSTYSTSIVATGGTTPYTYSISSGSLPTGLTLNTTTGVISGTPTTSGLYIFTITAVDPYSVTGSLATRISVNTTPASLADNYNRLQNFMCCIGSKGEALAKKLKFGTATCCDINNFEILVMYWSVLVCYDPTATTTCLTQTQINAIWDDIACRCGLCFAPWGSRYPSGTSGCGTRITRLNDTRITSLGDIRVINCGKATIIPNTGIGKMIIGTTFIVN